mmetsp:Transcript_77239/g.213620  ORF Transcript_77239/g.213620 Transcript_77239/m.213620 type:complete len:119 (+) Transcript_77239:267-623(+)
MCSCKRGHANRKQNQGRDYCRHGVMIDPLLVRSRWRLSHFNQRQHGTTKQWHRRPSQLMFKRMPPLQATVIGPSMPESPTEVPAGSEQRRKPLRRLRGGQRICTTSWETGTTRETRRR